MLRHLGRGAFADVFLAEDSDQGRQVALKVPRRDRLPIAEARELFQREARAAMPLRQPGLVAVYDIQEENGWPYIVREYIAGQDLAHWAGGRRIAPRIAAQVVRELADAVGFAHHHGLVHRDLKPANILMDADGHPHVTDFGFAIHESEQWAHKGTISGTPAYMSPEQVQGLAQYIDGRSDIWSLGVILYELLTGRRPFTAQEWTDLCDEIQQRDPRPPRQLDEAIPAELERIVLKGLQKRAADRYATAHDLAQDLETYLHPPATTRRLALLFAAAVLVIAVVAVALIFGLPRSGQTPVSGPGSVLVDKPAPLSPVRVESVEIQQLTLNANNEHERSGRVLQDVYQLHEEDGVQFRALLSRPAYCYWIAFRPDGVDELCFPQDPAQPPPLTDRPVYPVENPDEIIYALTDGAGMQAFVLVVSETPLPAYDDWRKGLPKPPWEPQEAGDLKAVFHHDGKWEETFPLDRAGLTRGAGGRIKGGRSPLEGLIGWVRAAAPAAAIEAWALPVLPREGTKL